jgi:hypothetical protein
MIRLLLAAAFLWLAASPVAGAVPSSPPDWWDGSPGGMVNSRWIAPGVSATPTGSGGRTEIIRWLDDRGHVIRERRGEVSSQYVVVSGPASSTYYGLTQDWKIDLPKRVAGRLFFYADPLGRDQVVFERQVDVFYLTRYELGRRQWRKGPFHDFPASVVWMGRGRVAVVQSVPRGEDVIVLDERGDVAARIEKEKWLYIAAVHEDGVLLHDGRGLFRWVRDDGKGTEFTVRDARFREWLPGPGPVGTFLDHDNGARVRVVDCASGRLLWSAVPPWPRRDWSVDVAAQEDLLFVLSIGGDPDLSESPTPQLNLDAYDARTGAGVARWTGGSRSVRGDARDVCFFRKGNDLWLLSDDRYAKVSPEQARHHGGGWGALVSEPTNEPEFLLGTPHSSLTIEVRKGKHKVPAAVRQAARWHLALDRDDGVTYTAVRFHDAVPCGEPDSVEKAWMATIPALRLLRHEPPDSMVVPLQLVVSEDGRLLAACTPSKSVWVLPKSGTDDAVASQAARIVTASPLRARPKQRAQDVLSWLWKRGVRPDVPGQIVLRPRSVTGNFFKPSDGRTVTQAAWVVTWQGMKVFDDQFGYRTGEVWAMDDEDLLYGEGTGLR